MTRVAVVAGAVACLASPARADSLEAIGGEGGRMVELAHTVDVEIADRIATFRVERELSNPGDAVVRAELAIDLPTRAVARSFRALAGDRWIDGALLAHDAADAAWERLTTTGTQYAHGPALLAWGDDEALTMRAYPVPPGARLRVAYTLDAPVCFTAGLWIADYPEAAGDAPPVVLHVRGGRVFTAAQLAKVLGRSISEACEDDVEMSDDDQHRYVVVDAPAPAPADVRFARVTARGADVMRVSIDVARELAPAPRGARVVFVVDASRSMGAVGVAAQLAWIDGYL